MVSSNIVPVNPPGITTLVDLEARSTEDLKQILTEQLRLTAEHLHRLAMVVKILEERGEDLSSYRMGGLLNYLRLIAGGQVLPEVVVRFSGAPLLISKISSLPEPDQRRLASGEPVKLVVLDASGSGFTHRQIDPQRLTRDQIVQVFGRAHIRPESEQIAMLEDRRLKPAPSKAAPARGKIRADRSRNGLVVNRTLVPVADVIAALADLKASDPEDDQAERKQVTFGVQLTEEEHARLRHAAVDGRVSVSELLRRLLAKSGLI